MKQPAFYAISSTWGWKAALCAWPLCLMLPTSAAATDWQCGDNASGQWVCEAPAPTTVGKSFFPDLDQVMRQVQCQPPVKMRSAPNQIQIEADDSQVFPARQEVIFRGQVLLQGDGQTLYTEELRYNRLNQQAWTDKKLLIQLRDLLASGNKGWLNLANNQARMEQVDYRIPSLNARGSADQAEMLDRQHSRFQNLTFTTCPPGDNGFLVSAQSLTIDQQLETGHFNKAKLRFLGLPIFYAPSLSFPLSDKRKSGVLVPTAGISSRNGLDLTVPYYFNLAPHYDATLFPRLITERGLLLGGEFRFLQPRYDGVIRGEILNDRKYADGSPLRGSFNTKIHGRLAHNINASLDINWASDDQYLEDLGRSLAVTSTRFLRNRLALSWRDRHWDLEGELLHFRSLDTSIPAHSQPYSLLPRLSVDWQQPLAWGGFNMGFSGELTHFYREDSITGQRIDLQPRLSLPLERSWGYLEPALNARYTAYSLDGTDGNRSPDRATFSATLDAGLVFERRFEWLETPLTQTLEPRAYYLYTPYVDQTELPLFDTSYLDFNFDNLFRDNRFNGPDRVGDANQLTLALTSRILSASDGRELLRAEIGQILYFDERRVDLYSDSPIDNSSSSLLFGASTRLFSHWSLRAAFQYDPNADRKKLRQSLVQASYRDDGTRIFNASWRLREGLLEQTDIGTIWPVSNKVNLIGRWFYSVRNDQTLEALAGIEYNACCWRARALYRRYLDSTGIDHDESFMIQLEFRGLGRLGHSIDRFLDRAIYGY